MQQLPISESVKALPQAENPTPENGMQQSQAVVENDEVETKDVKSGVKVESSKSVQKLAYTADAAISSDGDVLGANLTHPDSDSHPGLRQRTVQPETISTLADP